MLKTQNVPSRGMTRFFTLTFCCRLLHAPDPDKDQQAEPRKRFLQKDCAGEDRNSRCQIAEHALLGHGEVRQRVAGEKIAEVLGVEMSVSHMYDQTKLVSKSGTYSWMQDDMKYTFDPQAKKVNSMNLPEHYPNTINDYFDDVAYVMNSDEKSFYICDLAKSAAELVAIDLSEYNEYKPQIATEKPFEEYDPSIRAFKKTATTMNGKQLTIIVDVAGESKGKARVIKPGDSTAGTVISVMVRLN